MKHPIYVCSKGRPDAPLFKLLHERGLYWHVFVEPQDYDAYMHKHPTVTVMHADDRGLAYARQQVLDYVRRHEGGYYWMLDDDIGRFCLAANGKNYTTTPEEALSRAEAYAYGVAGIVGLEYAQFAWSAKPGQTSINSYCDCAVLIDSNTLADYRQDLPLKVDRDFTLAVIMAGQQTVRLRDVSFQVPTNGSNKGGLHDRYADGIEEIASRRMQELWPGICEAKVKPNGRPDVKINWRALR